MEQSEVGHEDVVEVDLWVLPGDVHVDGLIQTFQFTADDRRVDDVVGGDVDARTKSTAEQVDAHDAENEPEDQADE